MSVNWSRQVKLITTLIIEWQWREHTAGNCKCVQEAIKNIGGTKEQLSFAYRRFFSSACITNWSTNHPIRFATTLFVGNLTFYFTKFPQKLLLWTTFIASQKPQIALITLLFCFYFCTDFLFLVPAFLPSLFWYFFVAIKALFQINAQIHYQLRLDYRE